SGRSDSRGTQCGRHGRVADVGLFLKRAWNEGQDILKRAREARDGWTPTGCITNRRGFESIISVTKRNPATPRPGCSALDSPGLALLARILHQEDAEADRNTY